MLRTLVNTGLDPTAQPELEMVHITQSLSYACTVSAMIYTYDYLLTLEEEIELIWRRRFTLPTLLYILLRYAAFLAIIFSIGVYVPQVFNLRCQAIAIVSGMMNLSAISATSAIISLRVLALYNRNARMVCILTAINICQVAALVILEVEAKVGAINNGSSCEFDNTSSPAFTSLWWIPLAVDTILFIFTLIRLYWLRRRISTPSPLLQIITRDGAVYYFIICVVYILNILNHAFNEDTLKLAGVYLGVVLPALTACRLTLNLQGLTSTSPDSDFDSLGDHWRGLGTESSVGMLTTWPSRLIHRLTFGNVNPNAAAWFTGERWGQLQGVLSENPLTMTVVQE